MDYSQHLDAACIYIHRFDNHYGNIPPAANQCLQVRGSHGYIRACNGIRRQRPCELHRCASRRTRLIQ